MSQKTQEPKIRVGDINPTSTAKFVDFVIVGKEMKALVGLGKDFTTEKILTLKECEKLWV